MTISDVSHYRKMKRKKIIASHTRNMRLRPELRAYPFWARGEFFRSRKKPLPSSTSNFRHTGPVSAAWTSVGRILSRLWNWFGIAIRTLFTLPHVSGERDNADTHAAASSWGKELAGPGRAMAQRNA